MKFNFSILWILLFLLSACAAQPVQETGREFSGEQALAYASQLMEFGYRTPGSEAIQQASLFIQQELSQYNWTVEFQDFEFQKTPLRNITAKRTDAAPDIIIGTHYDTRQISDQESDPALWAMPVPGANDGTSGTAVLMELARTLQDADINVWLAFFDGEDQGNISGWDWSIGAAYYAEQLETLPDEVIIIDMIGDTDLNVYREKQSDQQLTDALWAAAEELGYGEQIINEEKYSMIDDHLPFIDLGIPTSLLIDFDYPSWHTQADTLDKISAESLGAVGQILAQYLLEK